MDDFVNKLAEKVGIDKATAEKVVAFLKEHADEIPKLLGNDPKSIMDNAGGMLGGFFGGKKEEHK